MKTEKKKAYDVAYRAAHREEIKTKAAVYHAAHRKEKKAYYAAHREETRAYSFSRRGIVRARHLKREYGLTPDAFSSMLDGQGGVCASCETAEWGSLGPNVDHDHATGKIRGILCFRCNAAAGLLKNSADIALALGAYLEANSE